MKIEPLKNVFLSTIDVNKIVILMLRQETVTKLTEEIENLKNQNQSLQQDLAAAKTAAEEVSALQTSLDQQKAVNISFFLPNLPTMIDAFNTDDVA